MGEKIAQALERVGYLLEGEESEGALMRIADTLEEVAGILETGAELQRLRYGHIRIVMTISSCGGLKRR